MKNIFIIALFLLILIVGISVGAQNSQEIVVNYVLASASMPVSTLIAVCMLAGFILALLLLGGVLTRLKWQLARANSQIKRQQASDTNK